MQRSEWEAAVEGILFAAGDPVPVERLCLTLEMDKGAVNAICQKLADEYAFQRQGIRILHLDNSWQMCSAPEQAPYVRKAMEGRKPAKLSQPALEVLAIIAYFQPVTRAYIESIRGVDSSYTVSLLLERNLIAEAGRLNNVPGRPMTFKTTRTFLRSFSLSSLDELPELPSTGQEGEQITLSLQNAIQKLQEEERAAQGEEAPESAGAADKPAEAAETRPEPAEVPEELPGPEDEQPELEAEQSALEEIPEDGGSAP